MVPKLTLEDNVKFDRIESDNPVEIREELPLLENQELELIDVYGKDYADDKGKLGSSDPDFIDSNLEKAELLFVENEVVDMESNSIAENVEMSLDEEVIDESEREQRDEWSKKLRPKFNPKTYLSLRFQCEQELFKTKMKIKCVDKEISGRYWNKVNDSIWLENLEGQKIPAENASYQSDIIKTLCTIYSGHELEIKLIKKEGNYHNLEIGKVDK